MRELKIDPNSLHWRLASVYGPLNPRFVQINGTDICEYTKAFLAGVVKWFLCMGLGAFAGLFIGDALAWLAAGIMTSFVGPELPALLALLCIGFITGIFLWMFVSGLVRDLLYRRAKRRAELEDSEDAEERQPSFIVEAYRSFKDKYCLCMTLDE